MILVEEFYRACTKKRVLPDGRVEIDCKLGLWSVSAPDDQTAEREAVHYWRQYWQDGEYKKIINTL